MKKQLVFIDDSGDPGFQGATSANFVMASAVFVDSEVATEINKVISDFKKSLGWKEEVEFKFRKTNKKVIKELLKIIPLENAYIKIDGRSSRGHKLRFSSYIRHEINTDGHKLREFKTEDSTKDNLIQLADLIAGSINRSLQINKTDAAEYISILAKKIAKIERLDLKDK